jgi:mRNA-degrading endonuclease toxin of MazEF toxin-antitoxin module
LTVSRGEIYAFDFGPRRSRKIEGRHYVLVVQTDLLNENDLYELTLCVPITSKARPSPSYVELQPTPESGLTKVSYAKCEQVYTLEKAELGTRLGRASAYEMGLVTKALGLVLGP